MSGSIGGADFSSYKPAQQEDPAAQPGGNMLTSMTMGGAANAVNASNQNMQFQLQMKARQALGPILQHAIDPTSGQLDYNKAFVAMATNPDTSFMAQDFLNNAIQRQNTQMDVATKQLALAKTQYENIGSAAASLLPLGPSVTRGQVISKVADLVGAGMLDSGVAQKYIATLEPGGQPLYEHLRQGSLLAMGAAKAAEQVYGQITLQNLGNKVVPVQTSPFMGRAAALPVGSGGPGSQSPAQGGVGGLPMGPTPEQMNSGVGIVGPTGETKTAPAAQTRPFFDGAGNPIPGTGNQQPLSPGGSGGPSGAVTGLPPAYDEYQQGKGPVADYETNLNQKVSTAQTSLQTFSHQMDLLKQIGTGATSETRTELANLGRTLGLSDRAINAIQGGTGPDALSASQEMMKIMIRNTISGLLTDNGHQRFTQGEFGTYEAKGSANLSMTPQAIQNITEFMSHLARMSMLEQQYFNKFKTGPNGQPSAAFYNNPQSWNSTWNQILSKLASAPGKTPYTALRDAAGKAFPQGVPSEIMGGNK